MKKRIVMSMIAIVMLCILGLTACKKNVGTPEDNAVSSEEEEDGQVEEEEKTFVIGFSAIDMENPYFLTLESAVREVIEKQEFRMITKDPGTDPEVQAAQIQELSLIHI